MSDQKQAKDQAFKQIQQLITAYNKQYQDTWELNRAELDYSGVVLSELETVVGQEIGEILGVVSATTNAATHSQAFLHLMENDSGARADADVLLRKKGARVGADAVIGIRYNEQMHTLGSNSETCSYFNLITAYGTAVRFK